MARPIDPETSRYLTRVQSLETLDRETESALARAFLERGDERAGQRVIAANLRHVVVLALRYRSLGVGMDELIAQGNLGLVAALRRFDPDRGVRFATYANHWVRSEMLSLSLLQRSQVGGGRGPLGGRFVFRMRRMHAHLLARLGDCPEVWQTLAERFRKPPQELTEILQRIELRDASYEQPSASEGAQPLAEQLSDEARPSAEEVVERVSRHVDLARAVGSATADLNPRERYILEHRLLADAESRLPLSEIGRSFGVSRERARQLEQAVRSKLRARLTETADQLGFSSAA